MPALTTRWSPTPARSPSQYSFTNKVATCENLTFTEPTMVAEWGLVCDRNWQSKVQKRSHHFSLSQLFSLHSEQATMSILMFGFLCGAFILGPLADRCPLNPKIE